MGTPHRERPRTRATVALVALLFPLACKSGGAPEPAAAATAGEAAKPTDAKPDDARPTVARPDDARPRDGRRTFEPPSEHPGLPEPAHLPEAARELVWSRMQGHGTDMTLLLWAVLFLDHEGAGELARGIVAEPRFSRPIGPDDPTLNGLLPPEFFALQDELTDRARDLVRATAAPHDGKRLARAYGELTAVCVRCHAVYLDGAAPARAAE